MELFTRDDLKIMLNTSALVKEVEPRRVNKQGNSLSRLKRVPFGDPDC